MSSLLRTVQSPWDVSRFNLALFRLLALVMMRCERKGRRTGEEFPVILLSDRHQNGLESPAVGFGALVIYLLSGAAVARAAAGNSLSTWWIGIVAPFIAVLILHGSQLMFGILIGQLHLAPVRSNGTIRLQTWLHHSMLIALSLWLTDRGGIYAWGGRAWLTLAVANGAAALFLQLLPHSSSSQRQDSSSSGA